MNNFKGLIAGAGVAAALAFSAGSASAAIETFADFSAVGGSSNFVWVLNNKVPLSTATASSVNSKGIDGSALVKFDFLQPQLAPLGTLIANFTFQATSTTPGVLASGQLVQGGITGSMSFTNTTAFSIGNKSFAAGAANLLTATFVDGGITGAAGSSSGAFTVATGVPGESIVFSSDILDFSGVADEGAALSLGSITKVLSMAMGTNHPINTFRALATGSFASDPVPVVAIPEPATWALMIVGLGLVGGALRQRNKELLASARG